MGKNIKKFDPELYKGTHKYYAKYRPRIPNKVIKVIVEYFNIKPTDRILDIGCGTGQVALAMEGKCGEIVCVDPDPEMIKWAKKLTKSLKTKLKWINRAAEDLGEFQKELGTFKLATFCRSFNWIDQEKVLKNLESLISEDGGIAVFGDKSFWTGNEEWQKVVKKIIQKYLGEERRAGKGKFKEAKEPFENIIASSAFRFIKTYYITEIRKWSVESIIGYLFSTSFAAPPLFGRRIKEFRKEVKNTLLVLNSQGEFQENAVWSIILGSKKPIK